MSHVRAAVRLGEQVARSSYRTAIRILPRPVQHRVRAFVARTRLRADRRRRPAPQVLTLADGGPVRVVSLLGLDPLERTSELDRLLLEPVNPRVVLVTDDPDLSLLRARAVSFEYVPAHDPGSRWFGDRWEYDRFLARRLEDICASYGADAVEHPSSS